MDEMRRKYLLLPFFAEHLYFVVGIYRYHRLSNSSSLLNSSILFSFVSLERPRNQLASTILSTNSIVSLQEHTVYFITRLLSPPAPADRAGNESHLIGYAPMLNVLIVGIASVDCVQVFSLHGLVSMVFLFFQRC